MTPNQQIMWHRKQILHYWVKGIISQHTGYKTWPEATGEIGHEVQAAAGENGITGWFDGQQK